MIFVSLLIKPTPGMPQAAALRKHKEMERRAAACGAPGLNEKFVNGIQVKIVLMHKIEHLF